MQRKRDERGDEVGLGSLGCTVAKKQRERGEGGHAGRREELVGILQK